MKINKNTKVLICGAGEVPNSMAQKLLNDNEIEIVETKNKKEELAALSFKSNTNIEELIPKCIPFFPPETRRERRAKSRKKNRR